MKETSFKFSKKITDSNLKLLPTDIKILSDIKNWGKEESSIAKLYGWQESIN